MKIEVPEKRKDELKDQYKSNCRNAIKPFKKNSYTRQEANTHTPFIKFRMIYFFLAKNCERLALKLCFLINAYNSAATTNIRNVFSCLSLNI